MNRKYRSCTDLYIMQREFVRNLAESGQYTNREIVCMGENFVRAIGGDTRKRKIVLPLVLEYMQYARPRN